MNNLQKYSFDYNSLDDETAEYLKDREFSMSKTLEDASEKLGADLYKAQQKLSQKGYGNFEDWYRSLGLKTSSVYRYINRYKFVSSNLEDSKLIETFQKLSPSLQSEVSKPSANKELNKRVFDGDITTHKEYKEQERILQKQKERIEELEAREPKVIEKEVKVTPHDYEGLKSDNNQLSQALKKEREENRKIRAQLDQWMQERESVDEKSKKYDELSSAIKEMEGKMDAQQKRVAVVKDITEKLKIGNQLIDELSGLIYLTDFEELHRNDFLASQLQKLTNRMNSFTNDLNKIIDQNTILEGEIINE